MPIECDANKRRTSNRKLLLNLTIWNDVFLPEEEMQKYAHKYQQPPTHLIARIAASAHLPFE